MQRIGIRELRQHASTWVRRAAAGETLEVTDRGLPVARLTPLPLARDLGALEAAGLVRRGRHDLLGLEPAAARPETTSISAALDALRDSER
jgi:prevent-host-death family protein